MAENREKTLDLVDQIIRYESGEMDDTEMLDMFAALIKNGQAWSLQGSYGRMAQALIDNGYITPEGEVV